MPSVYTGKKNFEATLSFITLQWLVGPGLQASNFDQEKNQNMPKRDNFRDFGEIKNFGFMPQAYIHFKTDSITVTCWGQR